MKHIDVYREVAVIKPGSGTLFMFWADNWLFDGSAVPLSVRFPRLYSYVLDNKLTAAEVYGQEDISQLFHLPLSARAFEELQQLMHAMQSNPLTINKDTWTYVWGPVYKSVSFYKFLHKHVQVLGVSKWIWKSCCVLRTKFFAWLLLNDRLNTRDLLQRRHW